MQTNTQTNTQTIIQQKTIAKNSKPNQWQYIFEAVVLHYDDFDKLEVIQGDNAKFKFVIDSYSIQHHYTQTGIANMLQGMIFDIEYYDDDIAKLLQGWGVKPSYKTISNYWMVLAFRILQIYKVIGNDAKVQKLLSK